MSDRGQLRRHIDKSVMTITKSGNRIRVENLEAETKAFIWDFYLSPGEARKLSHELMRLADEIDPVGPLDEYRGQ